MSDEKWTVTIASMKGSWYKDFDIEETREKDAFVESLKSVMRAGVYSPEVFVFSSGDRTIGLSSLQIVGFDVIRKPVKSEILTEYDGRHDG